MHVSVTVNAVFQGLAALIVAVGLAFGHVNPEVGGAIILSALGCAGHAVTAAKDATKNGGGA